VPARILLIIPNDVDRLLYEEMLPALGFVTVSASSMSEALDSIQTALPDLIILDEQVELADGSDPVPALRTACSALIVLSVWCSTERSRLVALKRGADDAVPKPPERVALAATVRCLYQHKQQLDQSLEHARDLSSRLRVLTERVEDSVRVLRASLSSAVLGINFVQEITAARHGEDSLAHSLADSTTALDQAIAALNELQSAVRSDLVARHLELSSIDVAELFGEASASRRPLAAARQVELGVDAANGIELDGDRAVLTRMAHNLIDASLRQTSAGGRVLLSVLPGPDQVEIAVRCSGRPAALDPGDGSERPTLPVEGVPAPRESGLEFCRQAVQAHGGSMRVEHSPDWPVSYVVRLPRAGAATG
jgi:two-component system, sensor histidine kinase and response regulator